MEQPQDSPPEGSFDEEMSLIELWLTLYTGWRLILASVAVALAIAGTYLGTTPNQYEATVVVKVGQVGVAGSVQQIESTIDAIRRMQEPGFKNAVVESLGWKGDVRESLFRHTYQVTSFADKHLKITLKGFSPDDANRAAKASLAVLADIHLGLAEAIVANRDQEFANVVADIADAEAFLRGIEALGKTMSQSDRERAVNRLQAVKDEKSRLRALRMKESVMKQSMRPEHTTLTMAVEPIVVSSHPVYPKASQAWLFSVIGGLLVGVFLVALRAIARTNRQKHAPVTERQ